MADESVLLLKYILKFGHLSPTKDAIASLIQQSVIQFIIHWLKHYKLINNLFLLFVLVSMYAKRSNKYKMGASNRYFICQCQGHSFFS